MWVDLDNDHKTITPLKILRTMQSLKSELQSIKEDNLKDRKTQHELNVVLLQNLTEIKQNPAHTLSNVARRTYNKKGDKE